MKERGVAEIVKSEASQSNHNSNNATDNASTVKSATQNGTVSYGQLVFVSSDIKYYFH